MSENRSLDEFATGSKSKSGSESGPKSPSDSPSATDQNRTPTADHQCVVRFDPAGGRCGNCETTAARRWRADGTWVCSDCMDW